MFSKLTIFVKFIDNTMDTGNNNDIRLFKCSSGTDANKLAGSIHSAYKSSPDKPLYIRVIGAGALNQAVKALIISSQFFAKNGIGVGFKPSFKSVTEDVTAIELRVLFFNA